jgi:thioredoxin 1
VTLRKEHGMSETLKHVTDESFEADVIKSDKPVVVDFWAPWCGPCRMMEPTLEELASEYSAITVAKLNVDENPLTATKYDILSIPTLLVFKGGTVAKKLVGAMPKKRLVDELSAWLG